MKKVIVFIIFLIVSCSDEKPSEPQISEDETYYDFFPLYINKYWSYNLNTENGDWTFHHDSFEGKEKWTVVNIKKTLNDTTYSILLERSGILKKIRTVNDNGNPVFITSFDTIEAIDTFTIYEDKNHFLNIGHEMIPNHYYKRNRYYSTENHTIISGSNTDDGWEKYRIGKGMVKGHYGRSSVGGSNATSFNLIYSN
jgi:hypothetical protein